MKNLFIFALLYLSGCSVFLSVPEPVDVGFPGRSDTGLLDVGSRDVRPDTMPLDMGVAADAGVPGMLVLDENGNPTPLVDLQGRFTNHMGEFSGMYVKNEYYTDGELSLIHI